MLVHRVVWFWKILELEGWNRLYLQRSLLPWLLRSSTSLLSCAISSLSKLNLSSGRLTQTLLFQKEVGAAIQLNVWISQRSASSDNCKNTCSFPTQPFNITHRIQAPTLASGKTQPPAPAISPNSPSPLSFKNPIQSNVLASKLVIFRKNAAPFSSPLPILTNPFQ